MKNYWHIQLHPNDQSDFPKTKILELLEKKFVIGLGQWDEGESQINQFKNEMKIGDIVLVRGDGPIALVKVCDDAIYTDEIDEELDWFQNRRQIELLSCYDDYKNKLPSILGKGYWGVTLAKCSSFSGSVNNPDFTVGDYIKDWDNIIEQENMIKNIINILENKKQIILFGAPGTGKTYTAKEIASKILNVEKEILGECDRFKIIQFHPAYSYEDFVRGIVTNVVDGKIDYKVENKVLAKIANDAEKYRDKYILIIDEINRANLPAVLGELIYALEYRNKPVESLYKINGTNKIMLPDNLFIIGTMNTADRSVGNIDYAIRRRFSFVSINSDKSIIEVANTDQEVIEKSTAIYDNIEKIFDDKLSSDFSKNDLMIGHSYFLAKDMDELQIKLEFEIKPLLFEYEKDGILLNAISEIENLSL